MSTKGSPNSFSTASHFNASSSHVWVYYPAGLQAHQHVLSPNDVSEPRSSFFRECRAGQFDPGNNEVAPYPGQSLIQESFFVCTVKDIGDIPEAGNIYVQVVIDTNCQLAFAKVYSSENAMSAVDILKDRVLPFYKRNSVAIERVITRRTATYCGLSPIHPFETFLAVAHIEHQSVDPSLEMPSLICEQFHQDLLKEFFAPTLHKTFQVSLGKLQKELDHFLEYYNHERPDFGPGMQGRPPLRVFQDSLKS
jgi:hypothetical protein